MHAVAYRGGGGGESPWAALLRGWQKKRNCWAMKGCFCFTVTISYDVNVNAWRSRILRLTTKKQKGHRNFFISAVVDISFVWRAANKITVPGGTLLGIHSRWLTTEEVPLLLAEETFQSPRGPRDLGWVALNSSVGLFSRMISSYTYCWYTCMYTERGNLLSPPPVVSLLIDTISVTCVMTS